MSSTNDEAIRRALATETFVTNAVKEVRIDPAIAAAQYKAKEVRALFPFAAIFDTGQPYVFFRNETAARNMVSNDRQFIGGERRAGYLHVVPTHDIDLTVLATSLGFIAA